MTELLEKASIIVRGLSSEMQDEIARIMLAFMGEDTQSVYQLTPEVEAEEDEADAGVARGGFATDEEVRAVWAKHGL